MNANSGIHRTQPPAAVIEAALTELVALARTTPDGCLVEVGVYQGGSAWYLSEICFEQRRALYLYDTFTGIPYKDPVDSHKIGDFADTSWERVSELFPTAHVIPGIFPASAIPMPPIAFAHLDCDQYRSVRESAEYLAPRMVSKGVMWFDDSPCLEGAHQAVREVFGARVRTSLSGKHFVEF